MDDFWNEDSILTDLLFTTNMSTIEIAKELGWSQAKTSQRIKQLGLGWVRRQNRKLSRGHAALTAIIQKLIPGEEVVNEHHVGEKLMLDIYCPKYKLAAEYHGRQHFYFSNIFHKDEQAFKESQIRDDRKIELCKEQGIVLVVFRYNDELTEEAVFDRIMEAIRQAPDVPDKQTTGKHTFKGNPYYEAAKQRRKEYAKEYSKKMKHQRKINGR